MTSLPPLPPEYFEKRERDKKAIRDQVRYAAMAARGKREPDPPVEPHARQPRGSFIATKGGTLVYIARDDHKAVLYVGMTDELFQRMEAHRSSSKWWDVMASLTWEEWPDRKAASRRERYLIRMFCPPHNTSQNPARSITPQGGTRPRTSTG